LILVLIALLVVPVVPSATAQDQVTIVFWTEEGDEVQDLITKLAEPFNAANPGIHVEIIGQENLNDVLRTAIQAGEAPDIIQTPGASFIAEYVAAD
jgi:ABC-type glycerol-3-phosphate transport system substrate-binding protein